MKILLTGAAGFLGWHVRVRLTIDGHTVVPVSRCDWPKLSTLVADVDAIVHVAGINRGSVEQVSDGNAALAEEIAEALSTARKCSRIVFANSVQSGNGTPYGDGKFQASAVLSAAAEAHGVYYVDVMLPNLFGEHGRPRYNSVVQTFIEAVVRGEQPVVDDRPIKLLHAQSAAQAISCAIDLDRTHTLRPQGTPISVSAVLRTIESFHQLYATGDLPPLTSEFEVDLFNTYRAAIFPSRYPIRLAPRSDERGSLTEVVRSHGGPGQIFVSNTRPGMTRGNHFHIHKVERFAVLEGHARINLRRVFDDGIKTFELDGEYPGIVDMPTMWAHSITNIGTSNLTTLFWANQLFDAAHPDTYPAAVDASPSLGVAL